MRVIPVLDLLNAQVVRGIAGRRSEYRPVESVLCPEASPRSVASALREQLGLRTAYLADLDAIVKGEPNWQAYESITEAGLQLMIDAGLRTREEAERLLAFLNRANSNGAGEGSLVAGLESLASPQVLKGMLALAGPQRLVFSLDMKEGRPLTSATAWPWETPEHILDVVLGLGVERFILLDLSRVGVGTGVGTEALCEHLRKLAPQAEIIAGGGVRGIEDLRRLKECGCDGALVASALHDGRLDRTSLAEFQE